MSSNSLLGNLAESLRAQNAEKPVKGPDLRWAERIMEKLARGERVSYYAGNLARQALAERDNPLLARAMKGSR